MEEDAAQPRGQGDPYLVVILTPFQLHPDPDVPPQASVWKRKQPSLLAMETQPGGHEVVVPTHVKLFYLPLYSCCTYPCTAVVPTPVQLLYLPLFSCSNYPRSAAPIQLLYAPQFSCCSYPYPVAA
jgi:hypothetical protein